MMGWQYIKRRRNIPQVASLIILDSSGREIWRFKDGKYSESPYYSKISLSVTLWTIVFSVAGLSHLCQAVYIGEASSTKGDEEMTTPYVLWCVRSCRKLIRPQLTTLCLDFAEKLLNTYKPNIGELEGISRSISSSRNSAERSDKCHDIRRLLKKLESDVVSKVDDIDIFSFLKAFEHWVTSVEYRAKRVDKDTSPEEDAYSGNVDCHTTEYESFQVDLITEANGNEAKDNESIGEGTVEALIDLFGGDQPDSSNQIGTTENLSIVNNGKSINDTVEIGVDFDFAKRVCDQVQLLEAMMQDINVFFYQLRVSGCINNLISLLRSATSLEEQKRIEHFVWYVWSKHSSPQVQEYMSIAKSFMATNQFDRAHSIFSLVTEIDPYFAEAYNKRATVNFGRREFPKSFADINRVLEIEPLHYGAMYCKALMLMKLNDFAAAIVFFEMVLRINPLLAEDTVFSGMIRTCRSKILTEQPSGQNSFEKESTGGQRENWVVDSNDGGGNSVNCCNVVTSSDSVGEGDGLLS